MLIGYNNTLSHILSIYIHTLDSHTFTQRTTNQLPDDIDGHSSGSSTSIQGKSYVYIRLNIHFILVLPHFTRNILCISCHFNLKPATLCHFRLFSFYIPLCIHNDFEFHPRALHCQAYTYYIPLPIYIPFHPYCFFFYFYLLALEKREKH